MQLGTCQVSFNEQGCDTQLEKFVDTNIRTWIDSSGIGDELTDYEVEFFAEESIGNVSCLIVVQSGPKMWRSWETGDDPQTAFYRSLENLQKDLKH